MESPMTYKNALELADLDKHGDERRIELLSNALADGTFLPNTVTYKDIDSTMKKWVEKYLYISYEGKELPTMSLFSNQRFSEYTQSWQFTDNDKNILMNFKTISREINPSFGTNQGSMYNIPGNRFYTMIRKRVLDDNGTESYLDYMMKQPFCVDIAYNVSIFTNKYQLINEFNMLLNDAFKARQCYIAPNDYYMPMILDSINDESEYEINDRQFFAQTFVIIVKAYIITENDFKIEERPARWTVNFMIEEQGRKPRAEIEESDNFEYNGRFYYKPVTLTLNYPLCSDVCKFNMDSNFKIIDADYENVVKNIKIFVNDEKTDWKNLSITDGDSVKVAINRYYINEPSKLIFYGYDPTIVYDSEKDIPEVSMDETNIPKSVIFSSEDNIQNINNINS